jgi:hypothetical protein
MSKSELTVGVGKWMSVLVIDVSVLVKGSIALKTKIPLKNTLRGI